jgi:adenylate kinase
MRVVILGPPAAGKGTQCTLLSERLGIPHISIGSLFREMAADQAPLGREVKACLDAGKLVSDDTAVVVMRDRVARQDCENGFLLDGFPRTRAQALALGAALGEVRQWLDHALLLDVPDDVALSRVSGRRLDPVTGRVYHLKFKPPPADAVERLVERTGDSPEAQKAALASYRAVTEPMLSLYADRDLLLKVDASGSPEEVASRVATALKLDS